MNGLDLLICLDDTSEELLMFPGTCLLKIQATLNLCFKHLLIFKVFLRKTEMFRC